MLKYYFFASVLLVACHPSVQVVKSDSARSSDGLMPVEGKLFTSLYQQQAAEYKALCLQASNLAALRLDAYTPKTSSPLAIVTDIDETVLDNSPYAVYRALQGKEYDPESWYKWSLKAEADTVPGVPAFLKYASSKGVEIFYITNREERERYSTLSNLQKYQLPNADTAHLFLKSTTSGKEPRRQKVAGSHEIVMFLGDNLADFSSMFDKKTIKERSDNVDVTASLFGNKYIIFPNPDYGDWEGALLNYNYKLSTKQKDSIYRSYFKRYDIDK